MKKTLLLAMLLAASTIAFAKNILIYGPLLTSTPNEQSLAVAAGHTVTVVSASQWSAMSTAQFAAYDAIVIPDNACASTNGNSNSDLSTLNANKSTWSPAITGKMVFLGGDILLHRHGNYQTLTTNAVNFAASGSGTGLYYSTSCTFYSVGGPVNFLSLVAPTTLILDNCPGSGTIAVPAHPVVAGLSNADFNDGCLSHNQFGSYPSSMVNVVTIGSAAFIIAGNAGTPATITPAGSTTFCSGGSVVLNANTGSGLTYQWLRNNSNITGAQSSSYTATTAGSYTVQVTDGSGTSTSAPVVVTVNPLPSASAAVTPLYPMSGQEIQTIYLGYPSSAQSETITVTPSGGTSPYSYNWTKGACNNPSSTINLNNGSNSFTHTASAQDICAGNNDNVYMFTITVTDNKGCMGTTSKKINVVNPYNAAGDSVVLCHKVAVRGGSTTQIMTISPSTAANHLSHGDFLGNCAVFTGARSIPVEEMETDETKIVVYPNPTTGVFTLELSEVREKAVITITDMAGKLITIGTMAKTTEHAAGLVSFDLSNYSSGMYLIQVKDGDMNYRTKIVVQ